MRYKAGMKEICLSCRLPKATLHCALCHEAVCKGCVIFLDEGTFAFETEVPAELTHTHYCAPCFDSQVQPQLDRYHEQIEQAKKVYFFFSERKKVISVQRKGLARVKVESCEDRNETILRLAFRAVQQGFNAVVEAEVSCEKIRNQGYQKSLWKGSGMPAQVDAEKLQRIDEKTGG